eukprot:8674821-Pyramimonas_sp.AAC.1
MPLHPCLRPLQLQVDEGGHGAALGHAQAQHARRGRGGGLMFSFGCAPALRDLVRIGGSRDEPASNGEWPPEDHVPHVYTGNKK